MFVPIRFRNYLESETSVCSGFRTGTEINGYENAGQRYAKEVVKTRLKQFGIAATQEVGGLKESLAKESLGTISFGRSK